MQYFFELTFQIHVLLFIKIQFIKSRVLMPLKIKKLLELQNYLPFETWNCLYKNTPQFCPSVFHLRLSTWMGHKLNNKTIFILSSVFSVLFIFKRYYIGLSRFSVLILDNAIKDWKIKNFIRNLWNWKSLKFKKLLGLKHLLGFL